MGLETLVEVFKNIVGPFIKLFESASPAKLAATTGVLILMVMSLFYMAYGLVKLGKLLWNLKIGSLTLGLTILGVILVALAIILPY
ncbi:MAG: hypothetical protein RMI56_06785 [Sulfolobales archaeon]|nr:hypothetical protein [Sulfolobales archaeon]MDW8083481.1 hypothetical protein [Sulfolobales archaeon]